MLKRLPPARAKELVAAAARLPASDPSVHYPPWYLHRWHFLPEGYLSRRSSAWYEHIIRNVYNQGLEHRTIQSVVRKLRALAPASILEVGCGPGRLLDALSGATTADDLTGIDLSPFLLERARRRLAGTRVRLVHSDGLAIPANEGAFDAVVAMHYLGHLPGALRSRAAAELARVIRPGGHAVVVDHRWHPWPASPGLLPVSTARQSAGFIDITVLQRTSHAP